MDNAQAKLDWLSQVLGVAAGQGPEESGKFSLSGFTDAIANLGDKVVAHFLSAEVEGLKKLGLNTDRLAQDQAAQEKALADAKAITDPDKRAAALERVRQRLSEIKAHANALEAAAREVMGKSKDAPTPAQKSAIYKKALEDRYGLTITVPEGMTNTHFDRVYDMMGTVPKSQAKHDKLKILNYNSSSGSGSYNRGLGRVTMGDFGDASGTEDYVVDGTTHAANSFDVTTLHELGHALDAEQQIMQNHGNKAGCGGWTRQSAASVGTALLAHLKKTVTLSKPIADDALRTAIDQGLTGTQAPKPDDATDEDWQKVIGYVRAHCLTIIAAAKPWWKAPVDVDGTVYVESYSNDWWSYQLASRAGTLVNSYQWRAPGEWFAEVYAISWLKRTKPPAAVDASVAAYMWQD
ncbi:hypothetical protein KAK07_04740 [Ideonella sp. 4Y16]|uniref:hypothetical protein n=1 Tax=Ideonella alba TaxID=2824118 RepID=UPI001B38B408|nr:hypothetical protein [Ideonella alba]MBQ0942634.1 hypothetical protein [Ideonella alba]